MPALQGAFKSTGTNGDTPFEPVLIPDSVNYVNGQIFENSGVEHVTLGNSMRVIGTVLLPRAPQTPAATARACQSPPSPLVNVTRGWRSSCAERG